MGAAFSSTGKTRLFYPSSPLAVTIRTKTKETIRGNLRQAIEERCPTLALGEFVPAWWLPNGHLQLIYCVVGDFSKTDHVVYKRTYLRLVDGGTLGLDSTPPNQDSFNDDTPVVVVMHGLTGGSHESYVRNILAAACLPVEKGGLGYRAVVINFRGCAGIPLTSHQFYSAGYTDDLRQALLYISQLYPKAPLLGLGFSLGANVIVRYLAEEKEHSRLSSACVLACPIVVLWMRKEASDFVINRKFGTPVQVRITWFMIKFRPLSSIAKRPWDLSKNNDAMESTLWGKYVYSKGMASNLLRLLSRHTVVLSRRPGHYVTTAMHAAFALKSPTLEQFDDAFTSKAGGAPPVFPFPSAKQYYTWASSHYVLPDVRVPLLALNAADDPIVQKVPDDVDNPSVVLALTPGGGHLGWFEVGKQGSVAVTRWITKPVIEWLRLVAEDLVLERKTKEVYVSGDGFFKEPGRDDIGCKVIDGGGLVEDTTDVDLIQGL
ncbi:AB-hydrolase YheT [Guyanagaster necrorhizus]|uniref:AB-hydrolase YheT n=1 Tax=Guyanagaster necrorhizus TaxID=856835 RepID=A0A9P8ARL1_9AGAR|nr:AB-hydrolase YheT [Guyanagaster necrorhizus MCA 3950]KAG7445503.1 AB-hydrolase YheT [Guyanagaster necrorhizus MCA 3950]